MGLTTEQSWDLAKKISDFTQSSSNIKYYSYVIQAVANLSETIQHLKSMQASSPHSVMMLGKTGSGMSSVVGYQLGNRLQFQKDPDGKACSERIVLDYAKDADVPRPRIGHVGSETTYCVPYLEPSSNTLWIDTPGIGPTADEEHTMDHINMIASSLIYRNFPVKSVGYVLSRGALEPGYFTSLFDDITKINRFFQTNLFAADGNMIFIHNFKNNDPDNAVYVDEHLEDNLVRYETRIAECLSYDKGKNSITELIQSNIEQRSELLKSLEQGLRSEVQDCLEKIDLLNYIKAPGHQFHICLTDEGQSKSELQALLTSYSDKPVANNKEKIDLKSLWEYYKPFLLYLSEIVTYFNYQQTLLEELRINITRTKRALNNATSQRLTIKETLKSLTKEEQHLTSELALFAEFRKQLSDILGYLDVSLACFEEYEDYKAFFSEYGLRQQIDQEATFLISRVLKQAFFPVESNPKIFNPEYSEAPQLS